MTVLRSVSSLKRAVASLLLLGACSYAQGADKLTESELMGSTALLATYVIDYKQTLDIKNHPGMYETNPILGKHPSDVEVRQYFTKAAIISGVVIYALPQEYRKWFIGSALVLEVAVIGNNKRIGLRTNF